LSIKLAETINRSALNWGSTVHVYSCVPLGEIGKVSLCKIQIKEFIFQMPHCWVSCLQHALIPTSTHQCKWPGATVW